MYLSDMCWLNQRYVNYMPKSTLKEREGRKKRRKKRKKMFTCKVYSNTSEKKKKAQVFCFKGEFHVILNIILIESLSHGLV